MSRRLQRGALVAAAALAALLVTELALRTASAAPLPPLFQVGDDGRLYRNPARSEVVDVTVAGQPDCLRIVWLGDSTVVGIPYDPILSPPRWLQWILDSRGLRSEVVGLAGAGLDAAQVAGVLHEALELHPDVVVVTTGHNEYLTPGASLRPRWWHRFRLASLVQEALEPDPGPPEPGQAPDHAAVARRFITSLARMAEDCAAEGVPLLLTMPVCNLADMPPVLGGPAGSSSDDADVEYARGREQLASGDPAGARATFMRARDLDRWPHRATSSLQGAVRSEAPTLVPTDALFIQASPTGVPGADLFIDHCHPDAAGQRLLALAVADAIEDLHVAPPTGLRGKALPLETGLAALGADAGLELRARAQVGRLFAGLALLRDEPSELAERAAALLLDPALETNVEPAELASSRTLLALARRDAPEARAQLALTARRPESLARLSRIAAHSRWVAEGFRRCGLDVP